MISKPLPVEGFDGVIEERMTELGDMLRAKAPDTVALLQDGKTYSYGDIEKLANRFANLFRSLGLVVDDKVNLLLGNDPLTVAAYFGAFKTGVVANPLHDRLSADEIAYIIGHSRSKLLITSALHADVVADAVSRLENPIQILCFGDTKDVATLPDTLFDRQSDQPPPEPVLPPDADALAASQIIR